MLKLVIIDKDNNYYTECFFERKEHADYFLQLHPLAKREGAIIRFLEVEKKEETVNEKFDKERRKILLATDWTMLADVKLDKKERQVFVTYRQYLRDLPKDFGKSELRIEDFEHWLRRNHPEEFMDGGKGKQIVKKFKSYY